MSTKIGLISDVHATPEPVEEAWGRFEDAGVDVVMCAGDIAGYGQELDKTIDLLRSATCQAILGNHDEWLLRHPDAAISKQSLEYLRGLPRTLELTIEGCKLQVAHASPPDNTSEGIALLDQNGQIIETRKQAWTGTLAKFGLDVLVIGHTHQVFTEWLGDSLVVNPGSSLFNHSCAVLELPQQTVKTFSLSGRAIRKSWHWGMVATNGPFH